MAARYSEALLNSYSYAEQSYAEHMLVSASNCWLFVIRTPGLDFSSELN